MKKPGGIQMKKIERFSNMMSVTAKAEIQNKTRTIEENIERRDFVYQRKAKERKEK